MEGEILDYEAKRIWKEVIKQGIEQGIEQGNAFRLVKSVEGAMKVFQATLEMACKSAGASVEEYYEAKRLLG